MLKFQVLFALCAIIGACLGTVGSDLEEENFRKLKGEKESDELASAEDDKPQGSDDEAADTPNDSLFFWAEENEKAENLPYESLEEFDKLRDNPTFPGDSNDESNDEPIREKRERFGLFSNRFGNRKNDNHKMDHLIRDTPEENSKFHGLSVLNDLENEEKE